MTRLVRARGTPPWLAVYALGLLCVFSFVLFEILDVDGSDFARGSSRVSIKPAEGEHGDVRRIALPVPGAGAVAVATVAVLRPPPAATRRRDAVRPVPSPLARIPRASLARALLSDVSPSA
jgi:hypothetical protein